MKYILIFLVCVSHLCLLSQKSYKVVFSNENYKEVKKNPTVLFKDSISALTYIKEFKYFAIKSAYLMANIDSLYYSDKTFYVSFFVGQKFNKAKINISQDEMNFLKRKGNLSEKFIRKLDFNLKEISQLMVQIHKVYENNGYPFSSISLENINISGANLDADLVVKRNAAFRFTKINLVGNPVVSLKLISSYIQIKEGDLFNQSKINDIASKISLINFIDEVKPAELLFTQEGVELFLYLKAKPVSLINGVVGLQPDPIKNKVFLTGELRLKLVNILKKAEYFDLNWRSIQAETQSLKAQGLFPNLFQTSFGLDGQFQLYKRDSTFLELKSTIGVQYAMKQGNFLKAFYRRNSSNVLASGFNNTNFANLKTVETNFYGLALSKQNLDYLPSPRKGVSFLLEGTIGLRKSQDNLVVKNENTYRFELNAQYYFPLAKRHVLKFANFSEVYFAPSFFQNEVYRFGGQISLRGFNEEELYATSRSVSTLEYRFLLDKNSYLFAFYDQAWYENKSSKFVTDTPFGFGAGFAFGTNIGNFSVSYAIGKQFQNQVNFRDGKVHFGYIAYF